MKRRKSVGCVHTEQLNAAVPAHSSVPWARLLLQLCSSLRLLLHAPAALLQAKLGVFSGFVYKYFYQESDTVDRKAQSKLGMQYQVELLLASDVTPVSLLTAPGQGGGAGRGSAALWHLWML